MINEILNSLKNVKEKNPLVYHLTNVVTINDCANVTLAIGASPLMSFCLEEIEEVISFSSSVVLNIGTMDKSMREMALEVGKIANRLKRPIVLDPVGVGATKERKKLVEELLKEINFTVIKGNMAEIKSILNIESKTKGVDSLESDNNGAKIAKLAAEKFNSVIVITGKKDYVSDGDMTVEISNGDKIMSLVSGTGCMISSLIASYLGAGNKEIISAIAGTVSMGIAGELAAENFFGTGTLKVNIIDNISRLDDNIIKENIKISPTI